MRANATAAASGVYRIYVYFATLPDATCRLVTNNNALGAYFNSSDNKIYAGTSTSNLGATGVTVTTGVWYRLNIKITTTPNRNVDVQVDETACGQATLAGAGATFIVTHIGDNLVSMTADIFYEDFVYSQTVGDYPISAGYVNHFVPTSDGAHNVAGAADFRRGDTTTDITNATTTAYQLVDEVPLDDSTPDADDHIRIVAPPNVTDYVELVLGPAPGISTPTVAPRAVECIAAFFAAGTGNSDEILKLNDNGTVSDIWNGTGVAGSTSTTYKALCFPTPPTGGAWTVVSGNGNFNNLRLRYGYATDANPDKSLMCAMVEAEFAEVVAEAGNPQRLHIMEED